MQQPAPAWFKKKKKKNLLPYLQRDFAKRVDRHAGAAQVDA